MLDLIKELQNPDRILYCTKHIVTIRIQVQNYTQNAYYTVLILISEFHNEA